MNMHANKESEQAANATPAAQLRARPIASTPSHSSDVASLRHYQQIANNSSKSMQLKSQVEMLGGNVTSNALYDMQPALDMPAQRVRDEELLQGKFEAAATGAATSSSGQRAEQTNHTGLPDQLKSGIEALSGMSMDHVKVHYNSDKPAQLQAHAYAQGSEIHVAPGQEQHLPHEAWHVVQQAQGRVQPTAQISGTDVNDDAVLENEADRMAQRALSDAFMPAASVAPPVAAHPHDASQLRSDDAPLHHASVTHQGVSVAQRALDKDQIAELKRRLMRIHQLLGPQIQEIPPEIVAREITFAIEHFDTEAQALEYLLAPLGLRDLGRLVSEEGIAVDSFERQREFREQHSPRSAVARSRLFERALSSVPDARLGTTPGALAERFQDDGFNLALFQRLHRSIQGLLEFANILQGATHPRPDDAFQVTRGLELLTSVGRLSMMLAPGDYFPRNESRPLPLNWTSGKFLAGRLEQFGLEEHMLREIEANLKQRREGLGASPEQAASNEDTRFPYHMDVYTGDKNPSKLKNTGAVRLDFSPSPLRDEAAESLSGLSRTEDLSYENIVRHLNLMDIDLVRTQLARVFHTMSSADTFFRELSLLLVGIEGSQNNMMTLHGPMIMDLVVQGTISWSDALFRDASRRPEIGSMPYFVYASDANQKGTDKGSGADGPMVRQSSVLRDGAFSNDHLEADARIKAASTTKANAKAVRKALSPEQKKSLGYLVFKNVYMRRQFQLQELFMQQIFGAAFFVQHVDDRGLLDVVQRTMENYLIHKFMGSQGNVDFILQFWERSRAALMPNSSEGAPGPGPQMPLSSVAEASSISSSVLRRPSTPEGRLFDFLHSMSPSEFSWNNCLIYAVAGAIGRDVTFDQIYRLRIALKSLAGERLGEELMFNDLNLAIILREFGITDATVRLYTGAGEAPTSEIRLGRGGPHIDIHYANHHFTSWKGA